MMGLPTSIVKLFMIAGLLFSAEVSSFKVARSAITSRGYVSGSSLTNKGKFTSSTQLHMDATLIPLLIGATGLIFAGILFPCPLLKYLFISSMNQLQYHDSTSSYYSLCSVSILQYSTLITRLISRTLEWQKPKL